MKWFTCTMHHPCGFIEHSCCIRAKNAQGARIAFGKLFHRGIASIVSVSEIAQ